MTTRPGAINLQNLMPAHADTAESREQAETASKARVDGRSLRRKGRGEQILFRTSSAYRAKLEKLALANNWSFSETFERAIDALDREHRS